LIVIDFGVKSFFVYVKDSFLIQTIDCQRSEVSKV